MPSSSGGIRPGRGRLPLQQYVDGVLAGDRVVLDRPGRPLRTDEALEPLRAALAAAGAAPGFELELAAAAGARAVEQVGKAHDRCVQRRRGPQGGRLRPGTEAEKEGCGRQGI